MGENKYGQSGHLSIFSFLKHLKMLLKCNFFRASCVLLIKDIDSMYGHVAQIFKVEILLDNAFKKETPCTVSLKTN